MGTKSLELYKWSIQSKKTQKGSSKDLKVKSTTLTLSGLQIDLHRRPYQRSIRLNVKPNGCIRVTSGKTTSLREIHFFLSTNKAWLHQTLKNFKDLRNQYPPKQYLQGEGFLYLGEYHFLNFVPKAGTTRPSLEVDFNNKELRYWIPQKKWNTSFHTLPQPQLRSHLVKYFEQQGRHHLTCQIQFYSKSMGLSPSAVSFRSQKTRWGSCSPSGRVSLNWRLIAAPPEVLDYVVIHELAHLKHLNHSPKFWKLVENYCPKFKTHRNWLRKHQYEFDFLAKVSEIHPPT